MSSQGLLKARKKTLYLPQKKLDAVKAYLHVATEREAVVRSLDEVLWQKRLKEFLSMRPLRDFRLTRRALAKMRRE